MERLDYVASSTFQIFFLENSDYKESSCAIKSIGFAHKVIFNQGLSSREFLWFVNIDNMKHINTV